jgi:hypothetical protein
MIPFVRGFTARPIGVAPTGIVAVLAFTNDRVTGAATTSPNLIGGFPFYNYVLNRTKGKNAVRIQKKRSTSMT